MPRRNDRSAGDRIVITPKKKVKARLTLHGPTSEEQGRNLAAALNAVIATYNTKWFLDPDGSKIEPRIEAETDDVS